MADETERRYGLRKRRRTQSSDGDDNLEKLLAAAEASTKIVVFSGSGLSAESGMSTFSTKGGLYERAQRKFGLADGKTLFTYNFYDRNKADAQAFFADIYVEAQRAKPAPGHHALAALAAAGRLQRHYTLNIDGLAEQSGMGTWHPELNPCGATVEMHGNVHYLVCAGCRGTAPLTNALACQLQHKRPVPCQACEAEEMRFKVMLYEDAEGECITPEDVMELMEEDVQGADLILWVGISFQQSASTAYFRNVRHWLQEAGRLEAVMQAVINPSDEALWNLLTASSNQAELNVVDILASSDTVLPRVAQRLAAGAGPAQEREQGARGAPPQAGGGEQPAAGVPGTEGGEQRQQQQQQQERRPEAEEEADGMDAAAEAEQAEAAPAEAGVGAALPADLAAGMSCVEAARLGQQECQAADPACISSAREDPAVS